VNLRGELVYPVADALAAKGVPFVFVTGYSVDGIDARFATVPVLQKPIEKMMIDGALGLVTPASNGTGNAAAPRTGASRTLRFDTPYPHA